MNKRMIVVVLLLCLLLSIPGYCANYNNWGQTDTMALLGRQLPYDLVHLGQSRDGTSVGTSTMVTGPTAIPLGYGLVRMVCSTKTNTLANGIPGQIITLVAIDKTGTLTIQPTKSTGWESATMSSHGHSLTLLYIGDVRGWIVLGYAGTTINYTNSEEN